MSKELDEFLLTAQDAKNLIYALRTLRRDRATLKAYMDEGKRNQPNNPIFLRSLDEVGYGLADAILSAQLVLFAAAVAYYIDPNDSKNLGFKGLASEFKRVCPEFTMQYEPCLPSIHTMEMVMDLRNKIAHKQVGPNYDFIQLSEPPSRILSRSIIIHEGTNRNLAFMKGRAETMKQFIDRSAHSSSIVVSHTMTHSMLLGEFLLEDAIECVKDYDRRKANPSLGTIRKPLAFP